MVAARGRLSCMVGIAAAVIALASCAATRPASPAPADSGQEVEATSTMNVTSPAYEDGTMMPARLANTGARGGENRSVPLEWSGAPSDARSFAIAMIDFHPVADRWVHWLVVDVPADVSSIEENASAAGSLPEGSLELMTTYGKPGYGGPQPPPGTGVHNYVTTVYALDVPDLGVSPDATWAQADEAMRGHVLATGSLTGGYSR